MKESTSRCQGRTRPPKVSAARSAACTRAFTWVHSTTGRRGKRSASAPAQTPKRNTGTWERKPRSPSSSGERVRRHASQPWATDCIQLPVIETDWPAKKRRRLRWRSERRAWGQGTDGRKLTPAPGARYPARPVTDTRKKGVAEELSALWRLAWPLALANAAQSLMGVVDAIILGRAGAAAQGGGGIAVILFWSLTMLGVGVMLGLDPLISQAVGAGDRARARHLLWQGVWLACAVAAGLAVPMALVPSALVPLGINADLARQASGYLLLRLPSLPFLLFFYAGRSYLQAHGAARAVLATAVAAKT